jgi:GxxExxY protein
MGRICGLPGKDIRDPETYAIIGAAIEVHRTLGSEFLEPAYQAALEMEFGIRGIPHDREVEMPIHYKGRPLGVHYRADFVCFGAILVERKALDNMTKREEGQVMNFGATRLQFRRFVGLAFSPRTRSSSVKSVGEGS